MSVAKLLLDQPVVRRLADRLLGMRSKGKLGGQHKVPRMDNSGELTAELTQFFTRR